MLDGFKIQQLDFPQSRPVFGTFGQILSLAILTLLWAIVSVMTVIIMIAITTIKDTKLVLILHNLILRLWHKDGNKVRLSGNAWGKILVYSLQQHMYTASAWNDPRLHNESLLFYIFILFFLAEHTLCCPFCSAHWTSWNFMIMSTFLSLAWWCHR